MKKSIKKILAAAISSAMMFSLASCSSNTESSSESSSSASSSQASSETSSDDMIKIGIIQLMEHAALDSAREGFIAALKDNGFVEGENVAFDIQNAQGDQSNLKTISQRFVQNESDLILAIATQAAQSIATETSEIPILGTAITDYAEAGLVESNEAPNSNISGTSDRTPVKEQIELLKQIMPDVKTVGIMYNSSEVNSEIQAKLAEEACTELGITCEFGTVTNTNDVQQAVQSMVTKVDALYIPTDNTFASAMATVGAISQESGVPAITGETGMVSAGGLATVGINYYDLGYQTGEMAVKVINGEDIASMPIEYTNNVDISINLDTAKACGIEFPSEVLDSAKIIVENGTTTEK